MLRSAILATALAASPAPADLLVVDQANGPFTTLTDAVSAAVDGDTILVEEGVYDEPARVVIDDLDVSILGRGFSAPVHVFPGLTVRDLAAHRSVTLQHLNLYGAVGTSSTPPAPAVRLEQCDGLVTLAHCRLYGGDGVVDAGQAGDVGLEVDACEGVLVTHTTAAGGDGSSGIALTSVTGEGGIGLDASQSLVTLYASGARGGEGGSCGVSGPADAGAGGVGAWIDGGTIVVTATITGGDGGYGTFNGGDGGTGLVVGSGAEAITIGGATAFGGQGGWAKYGDDGWPGADITLAGTLNELGGALHGFDVTSPVREGATGTLMFDGHAVDTMFVFASLEAELQMSFATKSVAILGTPLVGPIGPFGPPGNLDVDFVVPELGPGLDALDVFVQPVFFHNDNTRLGVPAVITLLDAAY